MKYRRKENMPGRYNLFEAVQWNSDDPDAVKRIAMVIPVLSEYDCFPHLNCASRCDMLGMLAVYPRSALGHTWLKDAGWIVWNVNARVLTFFSDDRFRELFEPVDPDAVTGQLEFVLEGML